MQTMLRGPPNMSACPQDEGYCLMINSNSFSTCSLGSSLRLILFGVGPSNGDAAIVVLVVVVVVVAAAAIVVA